MAAESMNAEESSPERPPLASYAAISTAFAVGYGALLVSSRRGRFELPQRIGSRDLLILGAASHKLSRLIAQDKVMSFVRAPFRRPKHHPASGEVTEEPRGDGPQRAIGELLGCPYCLALWISCGLSIGLAVAPRETRFAASTLTALTISDFLQQAYAAARGAADSHKQNGAGLKGVVPAQEDVEAPPSEDIEDPGTGGEAPTG